MTHRLLFSLYVAVTFGLNETEIEVIEGDSFEICGMIFPPTEIQKDIDIKLMVADSGNATGVCYHTSFSWECVSYGASPCHAGWGNA